MTSGYKSAGELEMEQEKKKEELNNRPVPLEWQVQRFENQFNKKHDEYLAGLQRAADAERQRQQQQPGQQGRQGPRFSEPPPPPPGKETALEREV